MTIDLRPVLGCSSISVRARMSTAPRPVAYAARMPARPQMKPPVGKSGPGTSSSSSSKVASGFLMRRIVASIISPRL